MPRIEMIPMGQPGGRRTVITFDERELAVVLFEALMELKRAPEKSVEDALADIEERNPAMHDGLRRASHAAMEWMVVRMKAGTPDPSELQ
jgi:ADP-ribosylglycohydrolase